MITVMAVNENPTCLSDINGYAYCGNAMVQRLHQMVLKRCIFMTTSWVGKLQVIYMCVVGRENCSGLKVTWEDICLF